MVKYKVTCVDAEGDELKLDLEENGVANVSIDADKFSFNVTPDKIKRLVDSIHSMQHFLMDFGFKKFEIEVEK